MNDKSDNGIAQIDFSPSPSSRRTNCVTKFHISNVKQASIVNSLCERFVWNATHRDDDDNRLMRIGYSTIIFTGTKKNKGETGKWENEKNKTHINVAEHNTNDRWSAKEKKNRYALIHMKRISHCFLYFYQCTHIDEKQTNEQRLNVNVRKSFVTRHEENKNTWKTLVKFDQVTIMWYVSSAVLPVRFFFFRSLVSFALKFSLTLRVNIVYAFAFVVCSVVVCWCCTLSLTLFSSWSSSGVIVTL